VPESQRIPWLLDLAQLQNVRSPRIEQVYDAARQMTHLRAPGYPAAIDAADPPTTKKADRETGEDQKGY
jgi:hypothetical protein